MKNYLFNQWDQASNFFYRELRILFFLMLGIFSVMVLISSIYFFYHPDWTRELYQELMIAFERKIPLGYEGMMLFSGIFFNNIWAGGMSILLGFIPFLFMPFWTLTSNALIIGIVGGVYGLSGYGIIAFLVGIIPHGLLEIPAFILGVSLGIDLCFKLIKLIFKRIKKEELNKTIRNALRIYFLWMVPLFLLAAIIETYMTPVLFKFIT